MGGNKSIINGGHSATTGFEADNGTVQEKKLLSSNSVINLDQGDPQMFEAYWRKAGEKSKIVIPASQYMSYFAEDSTGNRSNLNKLNPKICWFMQAEFEEEVRRLHHLVGNAVTEDRYILVGTGSMQLFQAALYAYALSFPLDAPDAPHPISVVCATPYYSSYPAVIDYLKSGLYKWEGDANRFEGANHGRPYIELITSPNNPDGFTREAVVVNRHVENGDGEGGGRGMLIHDLAYYWPHYTAITAAADHDIMLFTLSKATGHAGSRIGWAVVKDIEVAKKMNKYLELNTIGVSKDSQIRAAKIIKTISDSLVGNGEEPDENFFRYGQSLMAERWKRLRNVVNGANGFFSLPEYHKQFCKFGGEFTEAHPSFAWLKVEAEGIEDCESFLRKEKILTRSGKFFGAHPSYARVSMLDRQDTFDLFIERISTISSSSDKKWENN